MLKRKLNFRDIKLLNEIINFKILDIDDYINKNKLNYSKFIYSLDKIKENLKLKIIKSNNYIFYLEEKEINLNFKIILNNTFRKKLLFLYLSTNKYKLNIYKFCKIIEFEYENKIIIKKDLTEILSLFNINYDEYKNINNSYHFFTTKIKNYKNLKENILKEELINYYNKSNSNTITKLNYITMKIILEGLEIQDFKFIYNNILNFLNKYTNINSISLKYEILIFIILNLNNNKININKKINSNNKKLKNDKNYILLKILLLKIGKNENKKIYSYFIMKIYKFLLNKIKKFNNKNFKVNNIFEDIIIKNQLKYKNNNEIVEEIYEISEKTITYENENFIQKKLKKTNIYINKDKRINTAIILDIEYSELIKNLENLKKLTKFYNIIQILSFKELENKIDTPKYEQILIISNFDITNFIKNNSNIPIFFIKIENFKNKIKEKLYFDTKILKINKSFEIYNKFK